MLKTALRDYQVEAVGLMASKKRFVLADPTGKGKTLSVIAAFERLLEERPERRMLVLANKNSLAVWQLELEKHTDLPYVVGGTHNWEEASARWADEDPPVVVLSYPSIAPTDRKTGDFDDEGNPVLERVQSKFRDALVRAYAEHDGSMVLVLEEAHYCKSPGTKRHEVVGHVVAASEYAWAVTATPIVNRLTDLYHLFDLLIPGFFGGMSDFLDAYTVRERKRVSRKRSVMQVVGYRDLPKLKEKVAPFIVKRPMEGFHVDFVAKPCRLTPEEEDLYLDAAAGILEDVEDPDDARDFGARLPDLQLVVDGAVKKNREPNFDCTLGSKERVLLEGLQESFASSEHKAAVVFCYFNATFARLEFVLRHGVGKLGYSRLLTLTAADSVERRVEISREFSPGDVALITSAGKESISLRAADEMWLYDVPFSMGDTLQAVGRMTRMDSDYRDFTVYVPVAEATVDVYKAQVLLHKSDLFAKVLTREVTMPTGALVSPEDLAELKKELLWRTEARRRR